MAVKPQGGNFISSPWKLGAFNPKPPASLREATLQVAYVSEWRVKQFAAAKRDSWWRQCAVCRLTEPEQWAELCRALKIDRTEIEPRPLARSA